MPLYISLISQGLFTKNRKRLTRCLVPLSPRARGVSNTATWLVPRFLVDTIYLSQMLPDISCTVDWQFEKHPYHKCMHICSIWCQWKLALQSLVSLYINEKILYDWFSMNSTLYSSRKAVIFNPKIANLIMFNSLELGFNLTATRIHVNKSYTLVPEVFLIFFSACNERAEKIKKNLWDQGRNLNKKTKNLKPI